MPSAPKAPPPKRKPRVTWQELCRGVGLLMILVLFVSFVASSIDHDIVIDKPLALTFLGIATTLIGLPSGLRLIVSRNGQTG